MDDTEKHFSANMLDGDAPQKGQMLSSEYVLEYIKENYDLKVAHPIPTPVDGIHSQQPEVSGERIAAIRKRLLDISEEAHPVKRLSCDQAHASADVYHVGDHSEQYIVVDLEKVMELFAAHLQAAIQKAESPLNALYEAIDNGAVEIVVNDPNLASTFIALKGIAAAIEQPEKAPDNE